MMTTQNHRNPMSLATRALLVACTALSCCVPAALAADPEVSRIYPEGGQRGAEVELTLYGRRMDKPVELHWYDPAITTVSLESLNEDKDNRVKAVVKIAPEAVLGEHYCRLRTATGWTEVRTFHVGALPIVDEKDDEKGEHNNSFDAPQKVAFGSTVHGRVENEDVDYYAVEAKKGQRITAEVEGIRLGHDLFDAYVAIMDTKRFELASNDDTALLKQDPYASVIAPADGTYIVMIRESAYAGDGNAWYRLHIGEMPRPTSVYPPGGQAGQSLKVLMFGDPSGPWEQDVKLPDQPVGAWSLFPVKDGQSAAAAFPYRVVSFPNALEVEPNNSREEATAATPEAPIALNGIIEQADDHDWFKFIGKKDVTYEISVHARSLGSPLDAVINLYGPDGKHIEGNDDRDNFPDGAMRQKLPADGEYFIRVRDHLGAGGPDYTYRVEIVPAEPRLTLRSPEGRRDDTQNKQFAAIPAGNRWVLMVNADRDNFGGALKFVAENLPAGVTMHVPDVPGNSREYPVVFEAAEDAQLAGTLAVLNAHHAENDKITGHWVNDVEWVQGEPNRTPYYVSTVEKLPVAVTEKAPFKVRIEEPKTPLLRDGQGRLKIIAERAEGFDEEIKVQLPFRSPGVSSNNEVTIGKGQTEVEYPLNANGGAADGDWPYVVAAYATVGGGQLWVASPHQTLRVEPQFATGKIDLAVVEQGQKTQVVVKLEQRREFDGEARLELHGLPPEATAEAKQITKDTQEVIYEVTTTEKTPVGQHKSLFCSLVMPHNGSEMRQSLAGGGVLRVDKPRPEPKPEPKKEEPKAEEPKKEEPKAEAPPKPLSRLEQLRLEAEKRQQGK